MSSRYVLDAPRRSPTIVEAGIARLDAISRTRALTLDESLQLERLIIQEANSQRKRRA